MENKQDNLYIKKREIGITTLFGYKKITSCFVMKEKKYLNYALKKTIQKNTFGQKTTQSVSCNFFDDKQQQQG